MKRFAILALISMIVTLSSCAKFWGTDEDDDLSEYKGVPAKKLYTDAKMELKQKEYTSAIKKLEALETIYPFNDDAQSAQLDLIYAYYMKGLANFQQPRGTLAKVLPLDESERSPGTMSQSYSDFATLVQRFPNSKYKNNAMQRMIYLRNMFAASEFNVAKYYYERRMYVAAAERASYLVKTYPQAPSAKKALAILYSANKKLGLKQAANDAKQVYKNTYHDKPAMIV